jgi:hypothetical protein
MFRWILCFRGSNAACLIPVSSVKFVTDLFYFTRIKKGAISNAIMVVREPGNVIYESVGFPDTPADIPLVKLLRYS